MDHEDYEEEFDDRPYDADIQAYVRGQPLDKEIGDLIKDMADQSPSWQRKPPPMPSLPG